MTATMRCVRHEAEAEFVATVRGDDRRLREVPLCAPCAESEPDARPLSGFLPRPAGVWWCPMHGGISRRDPVEGHMLCERFPTERTFLTPRCHWVELFVPGAGNGRGESWSLDPRKGGGFSVGHVTVDATPTSTCPDNEPSISLVDRLRSHANDLNGDGCWRSLLNEAADEIEQWCADYGGDRSITETGHCGPESRDNGSPQDGGS